MSYNSELVQDMINYLSQLTSQRDYEVGQLANMLVKEFANEKGMTYTIGQDPISQYPEETEDAFDAIGMYQVFLGWRKQTLGERKTMKITRRQLKRIIREAIEDETSNPYGTGNYAYHDEDDNEDLVGHT